ncbi:MAG: PAS domain-containing protein [Proteobacteria bacterium]|nr:PAS domain-containing protein [Pseudomonadota bacterium]
MAEREAGIGHWRFNVADAKVIWSNRVFAIHGARREAGGPNLRQLFELYHPDDRERLRTLVDRALETGQGYTLEARILAPEGETRFVLVNAECLKGPDGQVTALLGLMRDITEARRAEHLLRALQAHKPGMISFWDKDKRCQFANSRFIQSFGRTPQQMVGIHLSELLGAELYARNLGHIEQALEGTPQAFERTLTRPSGEVWDAFAQYIPDLDEQGRVLGFYALITDVTPLKEAERRLAQANIDLKEARDAAEEAARVKGAFLSNMTHELTSPLTSIVGYAELLAETPDLAGPARRYADRIQDAAGAVLTTVNDLLDFSRLEAGQLEIVRREANPGEVARSALALFEPQMDAKGLTHRLEVHDLPPHIGADDARLRQILLNFISNAVRYTSAGGVTVRAAYDRANQRLRYEVADTGPGIEAAALPRLFQRFSQVDAARSQSVGGTGLGLSICRGLAEAMGGQVGVDSTPGQGSCFWLDIPCETYASKDGSKTA